MKRTGCIVAAALLLGLLLAGITGYFIWHSGQDKYVRAEMAGASEGVGIAGAEEPVPEETGGAGGVTNPDSVQGTDGPAYPMLQMALKNRTLKQEQRIRTRLCNSYLRVISSCQTMC